MPFNSCRFVLGRSSPPAWLALAGTVSSCVVCLRANIHRTQTLDATYRILVGAPIMICFFIHIKIFSAFGPNLSERGYVLGFLMKIGPGPLKRDRENISLIDQRRHCNARRGNEKESSDKVHRVLVPIGLVPPTSYISVNN